MFETMIRLFAFLLLGLGCWCRTDAQEIVVGAERFDRYAPLVSGKSVGLVVNHTSLAGREHLLDFLLGKNQNITAVFTPEHGLTGTADAGEQVNDGKNNDRIPIYSLYGSDKKPTAEQLENVDVMIFDIQDVGARFYTYISTMHYVMEACAENNIPLVILDRPNPNGMYVEGPVLDTNFRSFVGMHPIPVLHGLTVGELAQMINGEGWISKPCDLKIIPCANYRHDMAYELPVKPSPNLPNAQAVKLYPSLCLFEGTVISVGRGTYKPFQQIGHPDFKDAYDHYFIPKSIPGMSKYPKHEDKKCYGYDLEGSDLAGFDLRYLYKFFHRFGGKPDFFKADFFDKLCGTDQIRKDLIAVKDPKSIQHDWEDELIKYRSKRLKYLVYD